MLTAALLAATLAAPPAPFAALRAAHPRADAVADPATGAFFAGRLEEDAATEGRTPVDAAVAFAERFPALFGLDEGYALDVQDAPAEGKAGVVRLGREYAGERVFSGDVRLYVLADGRVSTVSALALPAPAPARFVLANGEAERLASAEYGGAPVAAGATARGWLPAEGRLAPAVKVTVFFGRQVLEVFLDAATGERLAVDVASQDAKGSVYEISPSMVKTGQHCTATVKQDDFEYARVYDQCAPVANLDLPDLTGASHLTGSTTATYNCKGAYYQDASTSTCAQTVGPDANGDFVSPPDTSGLLLFDGFGEIEAYYGIDKTDAYFKAIDPSFPGTGFTPGFTNLRDQDSSGNLVPFENAQFRGLCSGAQPGACMVFGQGAIVDTAYDGEVLFHEMTHAAVHATAQFGDHVVTPYGIDDAPGALNEGTADTFSVAQSLDPEMGKYFAGDLLDVDLTSIDAGIKKIYLSPNGYIRNVSNFKTCRGDYRPEPWGGRANPGYDGEVHDDGEVWGDFMWELHEGLKGLDATQVQSGQTAPTCAATDPTCNAADVAGFRAMEAIGSTPTFKSYAHAVAGMVRTLYGAQAGNYADCVLGRHDMDGCNPASGAHEVPVHAGEAKFGYFWAGDYYLGPGKPSEPAFQTTFDSATGATQISVNACSAYGKGTLYLRFGQPVQLSGGLPANGGWDWSAPIETRQSPCWGNSNTNGKQYQTTITIDASGCTYQGWDTRKVTNDANPPVVSGACTRGNGATFAAGTLYVLNLNSQTSTGAGSALFDGFWNVGMAGVATRPAATPTSCNPPNGGACVPVCDGVMCGQPDGCGGTCQPGSSCLTTFADGGLCTPLCESVRCGSNDGCGGTCAAGSSQCVADAGCVPDCAGKACDASDGCGGTCASACADAGGTPSVDAGPRPDAGAKDAGAPPAGGGGTPKSGCGCGGPIGAPAAALWLLALASVRRRRGVA